MSILKRASTISTVGIALAAALPVLASDKSPWLDAAGSGEVSVGYVGQSADSFFVGGDEVPLLTDLEQGTFLVGISYAISDRLTLDAQFGYSDSDFGVDPVLSPRGGLSGITDSEIGIRFSLYNANGAAVAVRATAIIAGDYDTGAISAIGDGGNGLEVALLAGKAFESGFSVSGEAGYRNRDNGVPNEWFGGVTGAYAFNSVFGAYLGYQMVRSNGDVNLFDPGFIPSRFPEVDEDYELALGGFSFRFSDNWSAGIGYGRRFDGRNTSNSDFWNIAASYSF